MTFVTWSIWRARLLDSRWHIVIKGGEDVTWSETGSEIMVNDRFWLILMWRSCQQCGLLINEARQNDIIIYCAKIRHSARAISGVPQAAAAMIAGAGDNGNSKAWRAWYVKLAAAQARLLIISRANYGYGPAMTALSGVCFGHWPCYCEPTVADTACYLAQQIGQRSKTLSYQSLLPVSFELVCVLKQYQQSGEFVMLTLGKSFLNDDISLVLIFNYSSERHCYYAASDDTHVGELHQSR